MLDDGNDLLQSFTLRVVVWIERHPLYGQGI